MLHVSLRSWAAWRVIFSLAFISSLAAAALPASAEAAFCGCNGHQLSSRYVNKWSNHHLGSIPGRQRLVEAGARLRRQARHTRIARQAVADMLQQTRAIRIHSLAWFREHITSPEVKRHKRHWATNLCLKSAVSTFAVLRFDEGRSRRLANHRATWACLANVYHKYVVEGPPTRP